MAEWIDFVRPPRTDFAETMTDQEVAAWGVHGTEDDPVIAGGVATGELQPFRVSLLRGRDG